MSAQSYFISKLFPSSPKSGSRTYLGLLIAWLCPVVIISSAWAQSQNDSSVDGPNIFSDQSALSIRLEYPLKDIVEKINDSTYLASSLSYMAEENNWVDVPVDIRIRGGFRKTYCYFIPLRLKIGSEEAIETIFEDNRKMKLVLPCMKSKSATDNLLKEYMAYKIYEVITPYHFKTRLLDLELEELKGDKGKSHVLKAFVIQDDDSFAREHNAKEIERYIKPDAQDETSRLINAFFQYMIANTDFSTVYLHNEKLFYIKEGITPVPYDFDMSGLVNASYAVVSQVQNETLPITKVTSRLYRGFETSEEKMQEVRKLYLDKEEEVFASIESLKEHFSNPKEFDLAKEFIQGYFDVLRDDKKFDKRIVNQARKN